MFEFDISSLDEKLKGFLDNLGREGYYQNPNILVIMLLPKILPKQQRITTSTSSLHESIFHVNLSEFKDESYDKGFIKLLSLNQVMEEQLGRILGSEKQLSQFINLIEQNISREIIPRKDNFSSKLNLF